MKEATVFLETLNAVLVPFPRSVSRHNPVSELYGLFLRPHGFVFALTCTFNCVTLHRQVCAFPNHFPADIFSPEQRRKGAVLLHAVCAIYMFYALAIVCDVYFVPSLEKISENLQLSEDVAGATFMAAGSSAPELFTSLIGVFITKGDLGVGTIVGSAVFNILVIIGICGIFAGQPISLSWWPLLRDSLYYILSILMLIVVIYDDKVIW
uniref:Sodium/calcium exchanger membrane region domain-containing protein n=1 Tax=Oncorhynchus tshawytscha TaxID=74940 RepID=A0AAZ3RUA2_ONCTS